MRFLRHNEVTTGKRTHKRHTKTLNSIRGQEVQDNWNYHTRIIERNYVEPFRPTNLKLQEILEAVSRYGQKN
jgi:hypothetical protein